VLPVVGFLLPVAGRLLPVEGLEPPEPNFGLLVLEPVFGLLLEPNFGLLEEDGREDEGREEDGLLLRLLPRR